MSWQDMILSTGSIIFIIALIPSLCSKEKPALFTSLTTGVALLINVLVFSSLALWFTAGTSLVSGSVWLYLAFQKYRSNNK